MSERSFERITKSDLRRLAHIARHEREDLFERHPEWALLYRRRVICSALCRGAALGRGRRVPIRLCVRRVVRQIVRGFDRFVAVAIFAGL